MFVGCVDEFGEGAEHLVEIVGELFVLLVLPGFAELAEAALDGNDLALDFSIETLEIECETAEFFGIDNGF